MKVKRSMVETRMTRKDMLKAATRITKAMNEAQFEDDYNVDQVLMALMFVLGATLKRRGVVIDLSGSIEDQLPTISDGYRAQSEQNRPLQ